MRRLPFLLLCCLLTWHGPVKAAAFGNGNLVVVRVGDGSAALSSSLASPTFLDEYSPAGTFIQTVPLPTTASGSNHRFVNSGTTSEGALARSADGRYLTLAGYDAAPGSSGILVSSGNARVVAVVAADGSIDTTTALPDDYPGNSFATAGSTDGSTLWLGGAGTTNAGVRTTTRGDTAGSQVNAAGSVRFVSVQPGFGAGAAQQQLYFSTAAGSTGVYQLGTGTPTSPASATRFATVTNPGSFVLLDRNPLVAGVDTLYVGDLASGLFKFSFDGSNWTARGSFNSFGTVSGLSGLTAAVTGGTATLFATAGLSAGNKLVKIVDSAAFNATLAATTTTLATAGNNTAFRGVQAAPISIATAVKLQAFTASAYPGGVALRWQTGLQTRNLGFYLYRDAPGGAPLNSVPIAGSALITGSLSTGGYSFWDPQGLPGSRYFLEDVDLDGTRTLHGPFVSQAAAGPAPLIPGSPTLALLNRLAGVGTAGAAPLEPGDLAPRTASLPPLGTDAVSPLILEADAGEAGPLAAKRKKPKAPPVLKLSVTAEGWYRLTGKQLLAAGLTAATDPRRLQLSVDGRAVPLYLRGAGDGRLQPKDSVEFYGLPLDTPSTGTRVYWLSVGSRPGARLPVLDVPGGPAPTSFAATVQRQERVSYFGNLKNGEAGNFFGPLVGPAPSNPAVEQPLQLEALAAPPAGQGDGATLRVGLQGVTDPVSSADHQVQVRLNGQLLGTVSFHGQAAAQASYPVPRSLLREGSNGVTLTAAGGALDYSLVQSVSLSYWRSYTALQNQLRCTAKGGSELTLTGFTSPGLHVVDVTDPDHPVGLAGEVKKSGGSYSYTVGVAGSRERTLFAFADGAARTPAGIVKEVPSAWKSYAPGADLLVLTTGELAPSVAPLVQARQKQGLSVAVVGVQDLYDEFRGGQTDPAALPAFLQSVLTSKTSWRKKPRWVLLAGDASLDPRGYLGKGKWDLVPTRAVETEPFETASDDALADLDGDGLPEVAVGRLPARSPAELSLLVAKTLAFEGQGGLGSGKALLVSDGSAKGSFAAASRSLKSLIPSDLTTSEVAGTESDPAAARAAVLSGLNGGPALVNYQGHGSTEVWAHGVLSSADARALKNQRVGLAVLMTCLNGYFWDSGALTEECLGKALLKAANGGSAAVWASSGLTGDGQQAALNRELFRVLFSPSARPGSLTLGEAVRQAKAGVGDLDVRRTWVLLGDPSARAR